MIGDFKTIAIHTKILYNDMIISKDINMRDKEKLEKLERIIERNTLCNKFKKACIYYDKFLDTIHIPYSTHKDILILRNKAHDHIKNKDILNLELVTASIFTIQDKLIRELEYLIKQTSANWDNKNYKGVVENSTRKIELFREMISFHESKCLGLFYLDRYREILESIENMFLYELPVFYSIYFIFSNIYQERPDLKNDLSDLIQKIIHTHKNDTVKLDKKRRKKLYSYVPYNENTINSIEYSYKYANEIFNFNDPNDPIIRILEDTKDVKDLISSIRIACLSTNPHNMFMFSHYADKHTGVCIEYDVTDIDWGNHLLCKVSYKNTMKFDKGAIHLFSDPFKKKDDDLSFIDLFTTKHKAWEYENEYRVITYGIDKIYLPITAIYFGREIDPANKDSIIKLIKDQ